MDKHEPPKVAPDDEDQLWIAPVLVAPRTEVSAPPGLTLSNTFSTLDDDDDDETGAIAPEPTPGCEHSWQYKQAEIVDSEECGQTSQNGYTFACPEPGNAVQIVAFCRPSPYAQGRLGAYRRRREIRSGSV